MKLHFNKQALSLLAGITVCVIAMVGILGLVDKLLSGTENQPRDSVTDAVSYSEGDSGIYYDNALYKLKSNLETVLILGIDQNSTAAKEDSQQADFLLLLIIDHDNECYHVLHLNRDTMTSVQMLNYMDEKSVTVTEQLCLSHAYGQTEAIRCRNTVWSVEHLLYGITVDHYISMTMDAVSILNDSIGGVTLTLKQDYTDIDPSYTEGTTVTLLGDAALSFVRARMNVGDGTNLSRMERQREYLGALFEKCREEQYDSDFFLNTMAKANEYISSNCSPSELTDLFDVFKNYQADSEILTTDGEAIVGREFMEFYVDEDALQKMVIDLFYVRSDE